MGKILAKRLQTTAEVILLESQRGFRRSRSTIDMIFTLRQLQEKAVEQQQTLYMVFIDLSKAFDTVDRSTLWILLWIYGCPETFVKIIQEFHDEQEQSAVSEYLSAGVFICTRSYGKLFQLARLKATTKTRELCIRELLFADDAAIIAHTLEDTRAICKQFEQAATLFRLTINTKKTVMLYQPLPRPTSIDPPVEIYGTLLKPIPIPYLDNLPMCISDIYEKSY